MFVNKRLGEITLVVIENLDGIGNNVTVSPGYVIATTLKPRYLTTVHKSSRLATMHQRYRQTEQTIV